MQVGYITFDLIFMLSPNWKLNPIFFIFIFLGIGIGNI
jgi:hypothetical protein